MPEIRHILFPYDGSQRGREIVPYVRSLAERFSARVTIFGVVPPAFDGVPAQAALHLRVGVDLHDWTRHLQAELDQAFVTEFAGVCVDRVADAGDPALRVVAFAHDRQADLIAMPTRGAGPFRSLLIGSVAAKVLHDARCPVWTTAHAEQPSIPDVPRRIICAVDGSPNMPRVIRWAQWFAQSVGASISLLHVVGPISDWLALESERRIQEDARELARVKIGQMLKSQDIVTPIEVAVGPIAATVAEEARQAEADLVIIDRGHTAEPLGRLRSNAFGIIQRSPCPVLSV